MCREGVQVRAISSRLVTRVRETMKDTALIVQCVALCDKSICPDGGSEAKRKGGWSVPSR